MKAPQPERDDRPAFLMLSRAFFEHAFWKEGGSYCYAKAWLDLIRSANWRDGRVLVGGKMVAVPRGGFIASVRFLAERWRWSVRKTHGFIRLLESEQMVTRKTEHGATMLILCNYELYNTPTRGSGTLEDTASETKTEHLGIQSRNTQGYSQGYKEEEEKKVRREEVHTELPVSAASEPPADKAAKPPRRKSQVADDEFLAGLRSNPAYAGVDINRELGKMQAWLSTPKGRGRQLTRGFIVNWLNRVDVKVDAPTETSLHKTPHPKYGV